MNADKAISLLTSLVLGIIFGLCLGIAFRVSEAVHILHTLQVTCGK